METAAAAKSPAAAGEPADPVESPDDHEAAVGVDPELAARTAAVLERALAEGWRQLDVVVECNTDYGFETVRVFGSGVAVWGRSAQFELTYDQVRQLLEAIRESGFADMADVYGGRTEDEIELPGESEPPTGMATQVICRVGLDLDGVSKQAVQLRRGKQFAPLHQLAEHILDATRNPARDGVRAAGLVEGLDKIARGELAPETLDILLHRKPEVGSGGTGWLLRLEGLKASSRAYRDGEGYAEPLLLELDPRDLVELARLLAEQQPDELPVNVWAQEYTDLKLTVLGRRADVQARRFAGMTPTSQGEMQERFDRIFAELAAVHERVMAEGRPGTAD